MGTIAFPERFWRCCKNKVLQPVNRVFSPKLRLVAFLFGCKIKFWKVAKLINFLLQLKITFDSITHLALSVQSKLPNKKRHNHQQLVSWNFKVFLFLRKGPIWLELCCAFRGGVGSNQIYFRSISLKYNYFVMSVIS